MHYGPRPLGAPAWRFLFVARRRFPPAIRWADFSSSLPSRKSFPMSQTGPKSENHGKTGIPPAPIGSIEVPFGSDEGPFGSVVGPFGSDGVYKWLISPR